MIETDYIGHLCTNVDSCLATWKIESSVRRSRSSYVRLDPNSVFLVLDVMTGQNTTYVSLVLFVMSINATVQTAWYGENTLECFRVLL